MGLPRVRSAYTGSVHQIRSARVAARDRHAPREPLERAPRRRLGDVLAPQRLARILPAAKLVAVARPEDAVVLGLQHLHRAARKAVGSEHFVLSVGAAPEADGHRVSLT